MMPRKTPDPAQAPAKAPAKTAAKTPARGRSVASSAAKTGAPKAPAPVPTPPTNHKLTNQAGIPVPDNTDSITVGPRGPILMQDVWLQEKLAHFDREVIPERRMHAKGSGAFGTFTVTHDISKYTSAALFSKKGKVTPVFTRFSTVAGERGAADAERDIRGFAVKFYTEEGNWDLVGNNTPVFFIRDPHKFPDLNHAVKRDPKTNMRSAQNNWDYWSSLPEALHQVTITMSDRGLPVGYRNMHGFGSHTFSFINKKKELVWVKFHWVSQQPILNWTDAEAAEVIARDRESSQHDLFNAIERKDYPRWQLNIQIMTQEQAAVHPENPFDITKTWSHKDYPLIPVGMLELNKNPENYFAEVEQAAFNPAHIVPGISYSPDKLLQGRLFSYGDAHRYRLGVNHELIPVNKPVVPVHSYHRDGLMRVDSNYGATKGYTPNSIGEWVEQTDYSGYIDPELEWKGAVGRYSQYDGDDPYKQPGDLWRLIAPDKKDLLIENTARNFADVTTNVKLRHCAHCYLADPDYGKALAEAAGLDLKEVKRLARLPLAKRLAQTATK
ncbi:MAG: catalase [Coriobacteriales bacterium]|jgi:catalase|nr:catalase [Coriobacteriales bacterium]